MDKINEILKKLQEQGYDVIAHDVFKNNTLKRGISFRENRLSPCIYIDDLLAKAPDASTDDIVATIIKLYEDNKAIDIDLDLILSKDYILAHVMLALQQASDEPLIKRNCEDFPDLEKYLYVEGHSPNHGSWKMKLNESILANAGLEENEVWLAANHNTFADGNTIIQSLTDILCSMQELDEEDEETLRSLGIPMYVVSNKSRVNGAVQVLDRKAIMNFAEQHGVNRLIVLPSSINEVIVIPLNDTELDLRDFSQMVESVNQTQLASEEVLSSHAYVLHLEAA